MKELSSLLNTRQEFQLPTLNLHFCPGHRHSDYDISIENLPEARGANENSYSCNTHRGGSLIGRMQISALKIHLQMLFLLGAHWSLSEGGKTGGQVLE